MSGGEVFFILRAFVSDTHSLHDGEVTGVTSGVTSELHVTFVTCNSLVTHL